MFSVLQMKTAAFDFMVLRVFQEKAALFQLTQSPVARNVTCEHSVYFNFLEVVPLKSSTCFLHLTR